MQVQHGDCGHQHVAAANAVANILGDLILPLMMWLDLECVMEQPATRIIILVTERFGYYFQHVISSLFRNNLVSKGTSRLFQWPSIARTIASVITGQGKGHSSAIFVSMRLQMASFGGFSAKPLLLQGTWAGLAVLQRLQGFVDENLGHRVLMQLTKDNGKWKYLCWHPELIGLCILHEPHWCCATYSASSVQVLLVVIQGLAINCQCWFPPSILCNLRRPCIRSGNGF